MRRLTGTVLIAVLLLAGCSGGGQDSQALVACKNAVKAQLAHPATADFKISATNIHETSAGYLVTGSLTGENGFGVPSEFGYTCEYGNGSVTSAALTPR